MAVLTDDMKWSDGAAFVAGAVVAIVIFGFVMYIDDLLNSRRAHRLAETFRTTFKKEDGDYDKAVAMLHAAKTDQNVEKDLLKALGIIGDVEFQSPKPTGLVKVVKATGPAGLGVTAAPQSKGGLLGDLDSGGADDAPTAEPADPGNATPPGFMPLDPYDAAGGDGKPCSKT